MNTVLLVDNEPFQRLLVCEILSVETSILIVETGDGGAAYGIATERRPDLVILDILLPHLDGLSLCRLIRADPTLRHTRLMILTALKRGMNEVDLYDAFLTRPYEDAALLDTVSHLLNTSAPND